MPTFRYAALDSQGRTVSGDVEGRDKREVDSHLRNERLNPLSIKPKGGGSVTTSKKPKVTRAATTPTRAEPKVRKPLFRK